MTTAFRPLLVALSCLLSSLGCSVFDESLIPEEPDDGVEELAVADDLSCSAPPNESVNAYRRVDLRAFQNNIRSLPNCLGELDAPGNDTFFQVRMNAREKWHFHLRAETTASDPAVYVLGSCSDLRSCRDTYWGVNACGAGEAEHFSFIAPSTGDYFVGLDGLQEEGERLEVFAVHAECGNGAIEHSESCDDSNDDPLDGCHECRPVLSQNAGESEPNDGPLDPNILVIPEDTGSLAVTGTFGNRCDFDFFRVDVPASTRLELTLAGTASTCRQSDLQLRGLTDPNPFLVEIAADAGDTCATISRDDLAEGTHLVRVARRPDTGSSPVSYTLRLELTPLEL